jgi:hypothetical protein
MNAWDEAGWRAPWKRWTGVTVRGFVLPEPQGRQMSSHLQPRGRRTTRSTASASSTQQPAEFATQWVPATPPARGAASRIWIDQLAANRRDKPNSRVYEVRTVFKVVQVVFRRVASPTWRPSSTHRAVAGPRLPARPEHSGRAAGVLLFKGRWALRDLGLQGSPSSRRSTPGKRQCRVANAHNRLATAGGTSVSAETASRQGSFPLVETMNI